MKEYLEDETIDPSPVESLKLLRPTPPREPGAIKVGRARFMSEVDELFPAEPYTSSKERGQTFFQKLADTFRAGSISRPVVTALGMILLVIVFLFGSAGITARASQFALPGDPLYSVKTGLEQARLSFAGSLTQQAQLYLQFASIRLHEIQELIQAGRYEDAMKLSGEFHTYIDKALAAVDQLSTIDPARAKALSADINSKISIYSVDLGKLMSSIPEQLQSQFQDQRPVSGLTTPYPYPTMENENPYLYPYQNVNPYPAENANSTEGTGISHGPGEGDSLTPTEGVPSGEEDSSQDPGLENQRKKVSGSEVNSSSSNEPNDGSTQNSGEQEDETGSESGHSGESH